jgi:hypothetical protein
MNETDELWSAITHIVNYGVPDNDKIEMIKIILDDYANRNYGRLE